MLVIYADARETAAMARAPEPGERYRGTEGHLGYLLRQAHHAFATTMEERLREYALTRPQFGLLSIPVFTVMNLLSGAATPLESMPTWLQTVMQISPSTHFVKFTQSVLFRDAGLDLVWRHLLPIGAIGGVLFVVAWMRFRRAIAMA